jgi:hypothetical protein
LTLFAIKHGIKTSKIPSSSKEQDDKENFNSTPFNRNRDGIIIGDFAFELLFKSIGSISEL